MLEGRCAASTLGLALFLREGMAAWAEAWSRCVEPPGSRREPSTRSERPVVDGIVAEVVHVLAAMALAAAVRG
ncbi:MAG: hypothetical protein HYU54_09445 [Actinobacteria bacterium]|nr:hypothetical protein [Actinomycetota bacterium]